MSLDFPPIYLLPTHLDPAKLHELEGRIPTLTYDINEADIVLGNITRPERAQFELRHRKVPTSPSPISKSSASTTAKRRRPSVADHSSSDSELEDDGDGFGDKTSQSLQPRHATPQRVVSNGGIIQVVRLAWLTDSLDQGVVLPIEQYVVYEGKRIGGSSLQSGRGSDILARALYDSPNFEAGSGRLRSRKIMTAPATLRREATSEHDADGGSLPTVPEYLRTTYSCQRPTPVNPPNADFVEELMKIRTTRLLIGDQIGVRAYSTSIATLLACPHKLEGPKGRSMCRVRYAQLLTVDHKDVARLPGCGVKIAELCQEWMETGDIKEASNAESDPKLSVLKLFYDIWGVGDVTARDFYNRGLFPLFLNGVRTNCA
jgi:DNA polymerase IV